MSVPFVDLHTHNLNFEASVLRINSLSLKDIVTLDLTPQDLKNPFSVGVHPWEALSVGEFKNHQSVFDPFWASPMCIGWGEVGLDRARADSYAEQLKLFTDQVRWVNEHQVQWLVIHNVRSQNEIFKVFKDEGFKGRALFHDYNGTSEEAKRLLAAGHILSLSSKILNPNTKAAKLISEFLLQEKSFPWGQVFLETDDGTHGIEELYMAFSQRLGQPLESVKENFFKHTPSEFLKLAIPSSSN